MTIKTSIQFFYSPAKTLNIGPYNGGTKTFAFDISSEQFKQMIHADFENFKYLFQKGQEFSYGSGGVKINPMKVEKIVYRLFREPSPGIYKEIILKKWERENPVWETV